MTTAIYQVITTTGADKLLSESFYSTHELAKKHIQGEFTATENFVSISKAEDGFFTYMFPSGNRVDLCKGHDVIRSTTIVVRQLHTS